MNISWKEAILQAQKRIDQVLDIKEEPEEVEENEESTETEDNVPTSSTPSVFTMEPTLPPVINNLLIGEDIQTIVSSDIELVPRDCASTPSPTEKFIEIEPETIAPNYAADEMLYKTINVLKKELTEYKNANQILLESNRNLERELEQSRFMGNQTVVDMLREEKSESEQDILIWKNKYTASQIQNEQLSDALSLFANYWKSTKQQLRHFKNEMEIVKNTLRTSELSNEADMRRFTDLIEKYRKTQRKPSKVTRSHREEPTSDAPNKVLIENWTQTTENGHQVHFESSTNERKRSENAPEVSNNIQPLLEIIEKLESEKQEMLTEQQSKEAEIRELQNQLNQTLIMHGEKMEVLDELVIDNEDLRNIMREQALMLTKM